MTMSSTPVNMVSSSTPLGVTTSSSTSSPIEIAATALNAIVEGVKETMSSTTSSSSSTTEETILPPSSTTTSSAGGSTSKPTVNVAELSASLQHFGIVDYCVFVLMLIVCAIIGFYFGFIEKKNKKNRNVEERRGSEALDYLVGGRKMKVFPVSLSLVASFVSGISLLGTSTEIYVYGTQYAFILITLAISGVISWYVFLPVFCNLQLTSTYEILWLPIVILVPALAFNQVTGINIHIITPFVCLICIFYTCVGGIKAVVWTDVIQTIIMIGAIIAIIVKGTIDVGGLGVVLQRNFDTGRLEFPTATFDPTVRISMFSIWIGGTFYYTQNTVGSQVLMQRFLSVSSMKEVKRVIIWYTIGVVVLLGACAYNGLLLFARYHDCDPLTTKLAKAKDQLVPLMVMDIMSIVPGMPGVFVAGVFSAALSSLSTALNSLAAVFLEDFVKPFRKTSLTERQTAIIMRGTVVIIGSICVGLVFVMEHLGAVIQLTMALVSVSNGPLFGLFIIGVCLPWINGKSALTGSILTFLCMAWVIFSGQAAMATGELVYAEKPVFTEGCTYAYKAVANHTIVASVPKTFAQHIYHMSFMLYAATGSLLTVLFSCAASLVFGTNNPKDMNMALFAPFIQRMFKPMDYKTVVTDEKFALPVFENKEELKQKCGGANEENEYFT